jgi:capsular polysaccharide transport system ATP-binding protein
MITLCDVKVMPRGSESQMPLLYGANAVFGPRARIGILAAAGSGKSALARVLSGIEKPTQGFISHEGRVSWPIGFAGFLHPHVTVAENIGSFIRLTNHPGRDVLGFCEQFCGTPGLRNSLVRDLTPTQRALLAYACSMSVQGPAMWIADEIITLGDTDTRQLCDAILAERLSNGGLVYLSRSQRQLERYCDKFYVLIQGRLLPCDDPSTGQAALDAVQSASLEPLENA